MSLKQIKVNLDSLYIYRRRGPETKRGRKVLTYRRTINVINSYWPLILI